MIRTSFKSELPGGPEGRRGFSLRRVLRRGRDERGTSMTELALVLPLLLVLLLGMIDFGKAFTEWIDETHLANEGARLAAVNYCPNKTQADCGWTALGCPTSGAACWAWYVHQQSDVEELKSGRPGDVYAEQQNAAQVCVSYPNGSATAVGDPVQVTVQVYYHWLHYLTDKVSLGTTPILGKATMRLESMPSSTSTACWPTTGGAGT
jgi:Flp pilus assembly protein TadG